ncbi:MAG TPA: hypothetical protein PLN97_10280, partial [Verrucomicrobiota bacterium]|nr:hypothetical protein [Verrucomicrobiota bacterium]
TIHPQPSANVALAPGPPAQFQALATLSTGRVQGVYKGCPPDVRQILGCTPDEHPLYTPCTRPVDRVEVA